MECKKVAIVTGGNKGIGLEIAKKLCQQFDGDVILTARDEEKGLTAVKKLQEWNLKPKFHQLDIDNEESLLTFKEYVRHSYGGIDILVNNAAICYTYDEPPVPILEQAEKTLQTNYTSTKRVCDVLFPLLRKHARVVNLSSSGGRLIHITNETLKNQFTDPKLTEEKLDQLIETYLNDIKQGVHLEKGWPISTYRTSKIFLTALTFIQHRKLGLNPNLDIVIISVHPGFVDTDMNKHRGIITPEQGAEAPVYLALLPPNVESPRGEFVWCDKTIADWSKSEGRTA